MHRAIFLDRDGVINRSVVRNGKPHPPSNLGEMEILPGVYDAMTVLHKSGWLLIVVTNQPDVARGMAQRVDVELMHDFLKQNLPIHEILTCYHDDNDNCSCRKPMPGALLSAGVRNGIDLAASIVVGDRWRDVEAGVRAGCKTIFIDHGYAEKQPQNFNYRVQSLSEAADIILRCK